MTRLKINKFQTTKAEMAGKAEMSIETCREENWTNIKKFRIKCVEKKNNIWHKYIVFLIQICDGYLCRINSDWIT